MRRRITYRRLEALEARVTPPVNDEADDREGRGVAGWGTS